MLDRDKELITVSTDDMSPEKILNKLFDFLGTKFTNGESGDLKKGTLGNSSELRLPYIQLKDETFFVLPAPTFNPEALSYLIEKLNESISIYSKENGGRWILPLIKLDKLDKNGKSFHSGMVTSKRKLKKILKIVKEELLPLAKEYEEAESKNDKAQLKLSSIFPSSTEGRLVLGTTAAVWLLATYWIVMFLYTLNIKYVFCALVAFVTQKTVFSRF